MDAALLRKTIDESWTPDVIAANRAAAASTARPSFAQARGVIDQQFLDSIAYHKNRNYPEVEKPKYEFTVYTAGHYCFRGVGICILVAEYAAECGFAAQFEHDRIRFTTL